MQLYIAAYRGGEAVYRFGEDFFELGEIDALMAGFVQDKYLKSSIAPIVQASQENAESPVQQSNE